jgi:hypothetical protein
VVAVEEWKTWEEGKPSQEEFRTVAAPFNQGGEYDVIKERKERKGKKKKMPLLR